MTEKTVTVIRVINGKTDKMSVPEAIRDILNRLRRGAHPVQQNQESGMWTESPAETVSYGRNNVLESYLIWATNWHYEGVRPHAPDFERFLLRTLLLVVTDWQLPEEEIERALQMPEDQLLTAVTALIEHGALRPYRTNSLIP